MTKPTSPDPPKLDTLVLHADQPDETKDEAFPVAPSISMSTTFRQPHPDSTLARNADNLGSAPDVAPYHVYSRYTQDTRTRAERVISGILGAHSLLYSSGLSASDSLLDFCLPSVIAIREGYFGVHEVIHKYCRGRNVKVIDLDDEYPVLNGVPAENESNISQGKLLVWLETPLNPTGEARDIEHYANRARAANGYLVVDATLAPPPLMDPFLHGADFVMHSGTKYFGGHSDLLMGILATKCYKTFVQLWYERSLNGRVPGNMETFLLLRSLRTMPLRVRHQSKTATSLVQFLHSLTAGKDPIDPVSDKISNGKFVKQVWHSSLQPRETYDEEVAETAQENHAFDPSSQLPDGGSPTFGILLAKASYAKYVAHFLTYFVPATSLGGVESLIEQRAVVSSRADERIVRISTGLEDIDDLKKDLARAMVATIQHVENNPIEASE